MKALTREEKNAIRTLKNLAERWPDSFWLYSANGELTVMRYGDDGMVVMDGEGVAHSHIVDTVDIPNDGGDW